MALEGLSYELLRGKLQLTVEKRDLRHRTSTLYCNILSFHSSYLFGSVVVHSDHDLYIKSATQQKFAKHH